jgi:hypothetical protein
LLKKKFDSALRKVRVEALAENDYAKDDWEDLQLMMNAQNKLSRDDRFMEFLSYVPFVVKTISEYQFDAIRIFRRNNRKKQLIINGDATGGIARNPNHTTKRIYYYPLNRALTPENLNQAA